MSSVRRRSLAVALAALPALPVAAGAAPAPSLSGPRHVSPGHVVSFQVASFVSGDRLAVTLEPTRCRAETCEWGDGNLTWLPDAAGRATIRFRWPRTSAQGRGKKILAGQSGVRSVPWKRGSLARVKACTFSGQPRCARKIVRIR